MSTFKKYRIITDELTFTPDSDKEKEIAKKLGFGQDEVNVGDIVDYIVFMYNCDGASEYSTYIYKNSVITKKEPLKNSSIICIESVDAHHINMNPIFTKLIKRSL